jgi:hypothetical protein
MERCDLTPSALNVAVVVWLPRLKVYAITSDQGQGPGQSDAR